MLHPVFMSKRRRLPYMSGVSHLDPGLMPSTLDLLRLPHVFSQEDLLDERQFGVEAWKRGVRIDRARLELLHRRRLLVPLLRVHQRPVADPFTGLQEQPPYTDAARLCKAAQEGRLTDPAIRGFRDWPKRTDRSGYLYSHFQLLSLRSVGYTMTAMTAKKVGGAVRWDIERPERHLVDEAAQGRALAIVLEALAARYLPRVLHKFRFGANGDDAVRAHIADHNPATESDFLQIAPELLLSQAESLLAYAGSFDPLGKWSRVVRIGNANRWKDLRFDALLAHEYRVAAEILLLYIEDLAEQHRAPVPPPLSTNWHEPRHDRLKVDHIERSETILDFRMLDRPAVVVAVEGETEARTVPRVLKLYGVDEEAGLIHVVNRKGVDGGVGLLARAVAVPRLDPDGYRGARLRSPATGLVLVVDPEGTFRTEADRYKQRDLMVEEVFRSLPIAAQTAEVHADLEYMIRVHTWGTESFELAHFSDYELAVAMRQLGQPGAPRLREVQAAVAKIRVHKQNIEKIWRRWPTKPGKVALADALWPVLERRLTSLRTRRPVPVADVVTDAIRLAFETRRVRELGSRP